MRALTAYGETAAMAEPLVAADLDFALDVLCDLAAKVTLDDVVAALKKLDEVLG